MKDTPSDSGGRRGDSYWQVSAYTLPPQVINGEPPWVILFNQSTRETDYENRPYQHCRANAAVGKSQRFLL